MFIAVCKNYGHIENTNIGVVVINEDNFLITGNSKKETLTVTITAENEKSESSRILQIFHL